MNPEQTIQVFDKQQNLLSRCTPKRARQLIQRKKARWKQVDTALILLHSSRHEGKILRRQILQRDGYICYICDEDLTDKPVTYDHIRPRVRGGLDTLENLAVCCHECNGDKGNRTITQYTLTLYARVLLASYGYRLGMLNRPAWQIRLGNRAK